MELINPLEKKDTSPFLPFIISELVGELKINTKTCKRCLLDLPLSNFNKHSTMKDGLRSKCIECRRLEHIEYRQNNPEKIKQLQKLCDERKRQNPDAVLKKKIRDKAYCSTDSGKLKTKLRWERWYASKGFTRRFILNKEQKIDRSKRQRSWRSNNRDKSNALYALRRASKKNATPSWLTKQDKEDMTDLYTICQMFKLYTGQEYHVDHIVPLVNKNVCGLHIPCNLRIVTAFENLSKNNKFDEAIGVDNSAPAYQKDYATS